MHEQGGRLGIFSDEGGILETLAGLYSQGSANIDILLKGIDGGSVRVRRKDRSFSLNPYLTIVLAVQPAVVRQLAEKSVFRQWCIRTIFICVTQKVDSVIGHIHTAPGVSEAFIQAYQDRIIAVITDFCVAEKTCRSTPQTVFTLSPAAQSAWRAYQAEIEIQLRPAGQFEACSGLGR